MAIPTGSDRFQPSPEQDEDIEEQGTKDAYGDYSGPSSAKEEAAKLQDRFESTTAPEDDDDDDDDDGGGGSSQPTGQRYPGGAGGASQPAPAGAGDEADVDAGTDPEAGDDSVRTLRPDAQSDPINEQTAVVQGRASRGRRVRLEGYRGPAQRAAYRAKRAERVRLEGYGTYRQGLEESGRSDVFFNYEPPDRGPNSSEVRRGSEQEVAQVVETEFLDDNPEFDAEDVRVVESEDGFSIELTGSGEQRRRRMAEEQVRRNVAEDLQEQTGEDVDPVADVRLELTPGGGYTGELRPGTVERINQGAPADRADQESELEASLERSVGLAGGSFASAMAPPGAEATGQGPRDVDLERGEDEDFTIETTDGGLAAIPTQQFQEEQARQQAELVFESQTGVDLDPQEDIAVDEEGRATLTESGQAKAAGDEYREAFDFPVPWYQAPEDAEASAIPGFRDVETKDTSARAQRRVTGFATDVGDVALQNPTVELLVGAGASEEQTRGLIESTAAAVPRTVLAAPSAIENLGEAGAEAADVYREEGLGGIEVVESDARPVRSGPGPTREAPGREVDTTGGVIGFLAGEAEETTSMAVEQIGEQVASPVGRARLAGSLIGTGLIMGGAAAIGPRAGFAARAAIQPGEEALGYGGGAVTRAVAGERAAARLFPNNEPLIFSEEAAIRGLRRGAGLASRGLRRGGRRVRTEIGQRTPEVALERAPGAGLVEVEPGTLEAFRPSRPSMDRPSTPDLSSRAADIDLGGSLRMEAARQRFRAREGASSLLDPERLAPSLPDVDVGGLAKGTAFSTEAGLFNLRRGVESRAQSAAGAPRRAAERGREFAGNLVGEARGAPISAEAGLFNLRRGVESRAQSAAAAPRRAAERGREFAGDLVGEARGAPISVEAGLFNLRRGLEAPEIQNPLSGAGERITGEAKGLAIDAEAAAFNTRRRLGELPEEVRGLGDLTLRVGPPGTEFEPLGGGPRELSAGNINMIELGEIDVPRRGSDVDPLGEADVPGESAGESDPLGVSRGMTAGEPGVAVERARLDPADAIDTRARAPFEIERDRGRVLETSLAEFTSPMAPELAAPTDLVEEVTTDLRGDLELRSDVIATDAIAGDFAGEFAAEGVATDVATDVELVGLEAFELELEFETETELEGEIEAEVDADRRRRDDDDVFDDPLGGWAERLERDLINPITGE